MKLGEGNYLADIVVVLSVIKEYVECLAKATRMIYDLERHAALPEPFLNGGNS